MKIKKLILPFVLMFGLSLPAYTADTSRNYDLSLSVNGKSEIQATTGDTLTVTAILKRTDSDQSDFMYGFQDEIRYDDDFLQIVDGMTITTNKIKTADVSLVDGDHAFYINFLSLDGQTKWQPEVILANFQVKILAEKGATKLKNENVIVSVADGSDTYLCNVTDLLIVVSSECTVKFDSTGGTEISSLTVQIGDLLKEPDQPQKEGYIFTGWYSDIAMKNKWDFNTDTVDSNMTLYAGWQSADAAVTVPEDEQTPHTPQSANIPFLIFILSTLMIAIILIFKRKTVTYIVNGKEYIKVTVKKNRKLVPPLPPVMDGGQFKGWYKDRKFTEKWNFDNDTVAKSIKLFARF